MRAVKFSVHMLFSIASISCSSTVTVEVTLQRPARFPLTKYERLAVGEFGGPNGHQARDLIQAALFQRGFEVLDRERVAEITRERGSNATAGAVIRGDVVNWGAVRPPLQEAGTAGDMTGRKWRVFKRIVQGKVTLRVRVTDASTRLVAPPKDYMGLRQQDTQTPGPGQQPPDIDPEPLLQVALQDAVNDFMKDVTPYAERRSLRLYRSAVLPELEGSGIAAVRAGDWQGATEVFRTAAKKQIPEREETAKAYYNLGVALMYTWHFGEARKALEKARSLGLSEANQELGILPGLEADHRRLQEQLGQPQ